MVMKKIKKPALGLLLLLLYTSLGLYFNPNGNRTKSTDNINVNIQDLPKFIDPAPIQDYKITPIQNDNGLAIGGRYWVLLSNLPTFQFGKGILETCAITSIGGPFAGITLGALVNKQGTIYTMNQSSPYQIYTIDTTTGVHTFVVNATGVPQTNFTGMTWDGTTMWGVSTNLTVSQIFTINLTTGVCTPIGAPTTVCAGAISISAAPNGNLYSIDSPSDNLYKWNKTTGVATLIGPLGANADIGQDAQFDWKDTTLYWVGPALYKININTGFATQLCTYTGVGAGIAIANQVPNGINNNNNSIPSVYSLSQNYPNPFNPSTQISFGLPKSGNVKLVVFDILGREVKTLVDEFKQAGNYNINFDGTDYSSGIYFYQLHVNTPHPDESGHPSQEGTFVQTKKMLIIK